MNSLLSVYDKIILQTIEAHLNDSPARIGTRQIAAEAGCAQKTVMAAVKRLAHAGALQVEFGRGRGGHVYSRAFNAKLSGNTATTPRSR